LSAGFSRNPKSRALRKSFRRGWSALIGILLAIKHDLLLEKVKHNYVIIVPRKEGGVKYETGEVAMRNNFLCINYGKPPEDAARSRLR
jgi:hypothetical protein